jgi:class 3 adenylate cyclase
MATSGLRQKWVALKRWLRPLSHAGVPATASHAERRELVTANVVVIFAILVTIPDAINFFSFHHPATARAAIAATAAIVTYAVGFLLIAFGHRFAGIFLFTNAVLANLVALSLILGTRAGVQYYFIAVGLGAMFVWPRRHKAMRIPLAVMGLLLFIAVMKFAGTGPMAGPPLPAAIVGSIFQRTSLGAYLIAFALAFYSLYSTETAESALELEHAQSESLLLNILPQAIAARLKQSPDAIADGFEQVTILFADVVGFTPLSERLDPGALVRFLNALFSEFDRLTEKHGLEKIKTIGDAYMVAGGIPEPHPRHAHAVAQMALDMQAHAGTMQTPSGERLLLRIGINTGPAVAGVIGLRKFSYDLWGDTVNTAARMESHGIPGEIQVTAATRLLLEDDYDFTDRGIVDIKGKGPMALSLLRRRGERAAT